MTRRQRVKFREIFFDVGKSMQMYASLKINNIKYICTFLYEGFHNFQHQHCPHLVIFVIEYFDLI